MKVVLKTITPLFIGKGQEENIITYNWWVDKNGREAWLLKIDLLHIFLKHRLKDKEVRRIIMKKIKDQNNNQALKIFNLKDILENLEKENLIKVKEEIKKNTVKFKTGKNLDVYGRKEGYETRNLRNFINFEKNNQFFYYIPGSSLKGALRTYILFWLLDKLNNKFGNAFGYLANPTLESILRNKRKQKKQIQLKDIINSLRKVTKNGRDVYWINLLEFTKELLEIFFDGKRKGKIEIGKFNIIIDFQSLIRDNTLNLYSQIEQVLKHNKKLQSYQRKFLEQLLEKDIDALEKFLINYRDFFGLFKATNFVLSDSNFLDLKDFAIVETKRKKGGRVKSGIPILMLALNEEKEASFSLEIKNKNKEKLFLETLKKATKEINDMIFRKYRKVGVNNRLIEKLESINNQKNNFLINLGAFSGASLKSFLALYMNNYPSTYNMTKDNKVLGWVTLAFDL
ncbi:MAG: type III-A CRISPR-associated RAMP protein Csm5 [Nanoarchaeota archaeon]